MEFRIVLTERASDDVAEINSYIAQHDPGVAERFSHELVDCTRPLSRFPRLGRIVPEYGKDTIREILRNPYRIIYRLKEEQRMIEIVRFWHAARGTPRFKL